MCVSIQQTEHLTRKQEKKGEKKKGQKTRNIRFLWQSKDRQRSPRGEMFLFCFLKTQTYKIKLYLHINTKKYSWPLTTFIWSLFNMNSCDFTKNSSVQYSWFSYSYAFPVSLKLILGVFSQRLEFKDQSIQQEWQQLSGGCWKSTIRVELNERGQSETLHFILKSFLNFGHVGGGYQRALLHVVTMVTSATALVEEEGVGSVVTMVMAAGPSVDACIVTGGSAGRAGLAIFMGTKALEAQCSLRYSPPFSS